MTFAPIIEKYRSKVLEVVLGATREQGGTRDFTVTVGGEAALPFLHFEGQMPHRPVIGMEIWDTAPTDWPACFDPYFADVYHDPAAWARKCAEQYGADLIVLYLKGADPDLGDATPEQCAAVVRKVLEAVGCPLVVIGCGKPEKDNLVMPAVAEAGAGENLLLGSAEQENYKSLTAAAIVHKHTIIAQSPIDINICKQLNILITEMNLPANRIVIDPTTAALGYGLEYGYSIMERARLGALQGDTMLSMPLLGHIGTEVWRSREATAPEDEFPGWGKQPDRGILWEATTAAALLQAGMDILVLRHPEAVRLIRQNIDELMERDCTGR
jgi:acetyl-CoA decarbonylase/synthase complex subunit delta